MNGLEPSIGMKKEGRLILSGYIVPTFTLKMEYTDNFPLISYWTPPNSTQLIMPNSNENTRVEKRGWYFRKNIGEENPFDYSELYRLRSYIRNLVDFLNSQYPIIYKGSRMRWSIGSLNTYLLQSTGDIYIDVQEAPYYPEKFEKGLTAFVGQKLYRSNEEEARERQLSRGALIKKNLKNLRQFDPDRVERGVQYLMKKEGLSSYNAYKKVIENNDMYNVMAEGEGLGLGVWNNSSNQESIEEANNIIYNGGRKKKTRKMKRRGKARKSRKN